MSELPTNWVVSSIGDLISLNPKIECPDELPAGFVPMQMVGKEYSSPVRFETRPWGEIKQGYTHFANGDVLLAKITPCFENGKAGLVCGLPNGVGAGSTEYFVSRPHLDMLNSRYLYAFLKTEKFLKAGAVKMTGSVGHKRVPKDYLLETELPLAPLNEQKRIADKLDAVLARVDACRDRLDHIPATLKRFRQSVLAAATSGKLTANWRDGDTSSWAHERAADVCAKVQSGGTPKEGFTHEGIPFLKVYNIVNQKVAFDYKPQYITSAIHHGSMSKSKVQPGDVLMNIVGPPLGKVAIVPNNHPAWNINQAITLFRPSERISTGWLYIILCGGKNITEIILETRGMVGQTNISLSQCRDFVFPIPPMQEQTEIVRRIEALFAYADRLEARHTAARAQVEKLTPATLAKAFRGELVPQDPNDEPASALLHRIHAQRSDQAANKPSRSRRERG